MISARRIAFLGVNEPLQAHMLATLGIWPDGLVPRAEVVFSLQEAGSDAVFSLQFPGATAVVPQPEPVTGFGGAWGTMPMAGYGRRRSIREQIEAEEAREEEERASEIAEAAVARAGVVQEPENLLQVMQFWAVPNSLTALVVEPVAEEFPPLVLEQPAITESRPAPAAALDEEAILAAAMMLFRRRGA